MKGAASRVCLTVRQDVHFSQTIRVRRWAYMVVDEGHRLKNADCKLAIALRAVRAEGRLLLTGVMLNLMAVSITSSILRTTCAHELSVHMNCSRIRSRHR